MSRLVWLVATIVAAFPTWELWRWRQELGTSEGGEVFMVVCRFGSGSTLSPLAPLRRDLETVGPLITELAIPALMVLLGLVACLSGRDPGATGRRVAGLLVMGAAVDPLASLYGYRGICHDEIPMFGAEWFADVTDAWGTTQLCLLGAAALVFAVSREAREGLVWRRAVAALVDYLVICAIFSVVVGLVIGMSPVNGMGYGFLKWVEARPTDLVVPVSLFLYFWLQHTLWGRTLGKRLLGIRVVAPRAEAGRMALRSMAFPLLALVPGAGLWCLLVDGLWMLFDREGRVLHDRLLGFAVVRDRPTLDVAPVPV
ncbi:RDD family protein [Streptosporangium saharense]|uniref:RDD family protein n=1 Tax=Streptosporangium saharense TaxID=1706840 RepID=UPI00367C814E